MARTDPEKVRQGGRGTQVLTILVVALVLCIIVFFGLGLFSTSEPDSTLPGPGVNSDVSTTAPKPAPDSSTTVTPQGSTGGASNPVETNK